jgi:hypothetical protein
MIDGTGRRFWFAPDGSGCRKLTALDITPAAPDEKPDHPPTARMSY